MKLSDFDYNLPKELIAQYPLKERDSGRLMVLQRDNGTIRHAVFKEITSYLRPGDLLILNNTKVLPARLFGARQTSGKVEVLLLNRKYDLVFNALIKPNRAKINEKIIFDDGKFYAVVSGKNEITFYACNEQEIYEHGVMPLPPYIKRRPEKDDDIYYQTVYASSDGSVAAPTAGLHFTAELLSEIVSRGVNIVYVTLHIGLGTFKPVKAEDISEHIMDHEHFSISDAALESIENARLSGSRIIAVGTTSLRAVETYALNGIKQGSTDLFIYPGYKFKIADCLLTNFHLPRTSLFILACAFGGEEFIKKAYQQAIENKYRFYSYGDTMLIC